MRVFVRGELERYLDCGLPCRGLAWCFGKDRVPCKSLWRFHWGRVKKAERPPDVHWKTRVIRKRKSASQT